MSRSTEREMARAWVEVTAHLPFQWSVLELCRMHPHGREAWYASAGNYTQTGWDGQEVVEATGKTPAQALANLAGHLARREPRPGRPIRDPHLPARPARRRDPQVLYRSPELRQPSMSGWGAGEMEEVG